MTKDRHPWIVWNYWRLVFECQRCGGTYRPAFPMPIGMFDAIGREFAKPHRRCKPGPERCTACGSTDHTRDCNEYLRCREMQVDEMLRDEVDRLARKATHDQETAAPPSRPG